VLSQDINYVDKVLSLNKNNQHSLSYKQPNKKLDSTILTTINLYMFAVL